jgi:hypothetical protein
MSACFIKPSSPNGAAIRASSVPRTPSIFPRFLMTGQIRFISIFIICQRPATPRSPRLCCQPSIGLSALKTLLPGGINQWSGGFCWGWWHFWLSAHIAVCVGRSNAGLRVRPDHLSIVVDPDPDPQAKLGRGLNFPIERSGLNVLSESSPRRKTTCAEGFYLAQA